MKYSAMILVVLTLLWVASAQAEASKTPAQIKNSPIELAGESPLIRVTFNHATHRHIGVSCKNCHHETSANIPYSSCRDACHATTGARERDPDSMFMAFHAKGTERSCYGCHSMRAEKNPEAYPEFRNCRPCHTGDPVEAPASANKTAK